MNEDSQKYTNMNDPEIVKLLIRKDERIAALEEENRKLREALIAAKDHLEWTGYGDNYERKCAYEDKLPEKIENALNQK